jgi:hypothetical protein
VPDYILGLTDFAEGCLEESGFKALAGDLKNPLECLSHITQLPLFFEKLMGRGKEFLQGGRLLFCGSLYLTGYIKAWDKRWKGSSGFLREKNLWSAER